MLTTEAQSFVFTGALEGENLSARPCGSCGKLVLRFLEASFPRRGETVRNPFFRVFHCFMAPAASIGPIEHDLRSLSSSASPPRLTAGTRRHNEIFGIGGAGLFTEWRLQHQRKCWASGSAETPPDPARLALSLLHGTEPCLPGSFRPGASYWVVTTRSSSYSS